MSQMEPVFCHAPETLRLVQVVRLLDETLRQASPADRERMRPSVEAFIEQGRSIARDGLIPLRT